MDEKIRAAPLRSRKTTNSATYCDTAAAANLKSVARSELGSDARDEFSNRGLGLPLHRSLALSRRLPGNFQD